MIELSDDLSLEDLKAIRETVNQKIKERQMRGFNELLAQANKLGIDLPSFVMQAMNDNKPKYRDEHGNEWGGSTRGRKPAWVQRLIEAGEDIEKYRVQEA